MSDFIKTRRRFLEMLSVLSLAPSVLYGNGFSKKAVPRIGYLGSAGSLAMENVFKDEMQKLGYAEGQNIHIEQRLARPNTTDEANMTSELSAMDLSLIVAAALPFAISIRKANPKMPMVIATCPGMVSNGFAQTLEHPGGIYTGLDELPPGVTVKRLQLLNAVAPNAKRIALLSTTPGTGGHEMQLEDAEKTAVTLGVKVKAYRAASVPELEKALADLVNDGMNGMLCFQGRLSLTNRQLITGFMVGHRLPAIYQATAFAEAGGLMTWAPDLPLQFCEAARYVDKILKGAKPGDLPVKHPEKYYLTLNAKAAKEIGISFPNDLLAQATKVIE